MMQRDYYCLVAGLPDIMIEDTKLLLTQQRFRTELKDELHQDDFALVNCLFLPIDNANLLNLLLKNDRPFNPDGQFSHDELEEEIKETQNLPDYLIHFIDAYKNDQPVYPRLSLENQLTALNYQAMEQIPNEFLRDWFGFELNLRNCLVGLTCRKFNLSSETELIGDNHVVESIRRSNLADFGLSKDFTYIDTITHWFDNDELIEREKGIDILRWDYLDQQVFFHYFSIERILSFMIKLGILERWLRLDRELGMKLFNKIIKELESRFVFPEEFSINGGKKHGIER